MHFALPEKAHLMEAGVTGAPVSILRREHDELLAWADTNLDAIHRERVTSTYFIAHNIARGAGERHARLLFSKSTLLLFGLDEFFDADGITPEAVAVVAGVFRDGSAERAESYPDPGKRATLAKLHRVATELAEETSALQQRDLRPRLQHLFRENNVGQTTEFERRWTPTRISLDEYMSYARVTIGVGLVLELTFYGMDPFPAGLIHEPELISLLATSSDVIRVLNDIRSYEKECAEGKSNAVGILMHERGIASAQRAVESLLEHFIAPRMSRLERFARTPGVVPRAQAQVAFDLCRTTAWFYQNNDFKSYSELLAGFGMLSWQDASREELVR